jgi:hypothetical protein
VVSYDMPWNPQRVVQRNGRVIRLLSPHEEVFLTTMLPEPGDLLDLLRLEATVRAKIRAAGIFGMESEVIEGIELELRSYAARLADGEIDLTEEEVGGGELSGAFLGEELRARLARARDEGELERLRRLPWGIGAVVRAPANASTGAAGVFFAARTRKMAGAAEGHRYWRWVPWDDDKETSLVSSDLEILRRIDPDRVTVVEPGEVDIERAWTRACADIVSEHNRRADPRAVQESIGPAQRFALDLLRDPSVMLPPGAELAAEALSAERSSAVRRALNAIRADLAEERISRNAAAERVVGLVLDLGLRPLEPEPLPEEIGPEELGVVCWMAVLPPE